MIFLDSNIPMYIVGADHPNRTLSIALVQKLTLDRVPLYSDVEVLQEILHRYISINRRSLVQPTFDYLLEVTEDVFPVELDDLIAAKMAADQFPSLSARDAVHVAVMRKHGIDTILTFDSGFDQVSDISRLATI